MASFSIATTPRCSRGRGKIGKLIDLYESVKNKGDWMRRANRSNDRILDIQTNSINAEQNLFY